jgi:hypothetical protein
VIDRGKLLKDLQRRVRVLEDDLREQVAALKDVDARLRAEHERAFKLGRTAATWPAWRDDRVTQAAVAWVLGTVFVRFCEDNGLLASPYLAGPSAERMTLAEEAQEQFFRDRPAETDRGWLLASFDALRVAQAGEFLFSERHNPLYQIPVSHDAAKALIAFWRRRGEDGRLVHDFADPAWDTRFLGDLYQDLSESARKTYALLQTPEFVEEFILDRTLTPAIDEFGYDEVKLIDPTCGSGHFLLGAFRRLLTEWEHHSPARDAQERVRLALEAIHGVDINPFAVAIARFRLLVEALRAAGFRSFSEASGYSFPIKVAVGDSLIKTRQLSFDGLGDELAEFQYFTEDVLEFPAMLKEGGYHVVVGNPPYITVKDKKLNQLYRELYDTCAGTYALSVPFAQRFFELARPADNDGRGPGYVGQITANSFMKREFGKKIIENFFAHQVELTHVVDTSGAYIPGHGTPTVILVGRRRAPHRTEAIRFVMGIRGEPNAPDDARRGLVWSAIEEQIDRPGSESEWVSVADLPRDRLARHPWSISGGGASELQDAIEETSRSSLGSLAELGTGAVTRENEVFIVGLGTLKRLRIPARYHRLLLDGEYLRDWQFRDGMVALWPYEIPSLKPADDCLISRFLWPFRTQLSRRVAFGKSQTERGLPWTTYSMFFTKRFGGNTIAFSFVATHNQFVLDRSDRVFNRTAPIIKLREKTEEDEHLRLIGVLNSSTACFWLKQVSHDKGIRGEGGGFTSDDWEHFYEFTGTKLEEFPLPETYPLNLARELDGLAQQLAAVSPSAVTAERTPTWERLTEARRVWEATRRQMIALQEELDWQVYSLYGLLADELTAPEQAVPELRLGERAFEIVLARRMAAGEIETEWFARHGSTPITEIPGHWPAEYRAVVEKRIGVIESNRGIALIERPECKRRWATEGWDSMEAKALREWLLDRCEARHLWFHHVDGMEQPRLLTTSQLADELRRDPDVLAVAELRYPGKDLGAVVAELVADEHVPYLAALRYKDSGLQKRADWEHTWDLQRQEDAAPTEEEKRKTRDTIPVPLKYGSGDFLKTSYWRNRGKLDVPRERFISYPHASRDGDPALLLGWAGWDHREQAQALATLVVEREQRDGWGSERLAPLLAGLREVLPWVRQWHGEFHPAYGGSPAVVYAGFLADYQNRLRLTDEGLAAWRAPKAARGRRKARA